MNKRVSQIRGFHPMTEADKTEQKYWLSRTPAARLRELERLRQFNYGYGQGKPLPRFQRTLRIAKLGEVPLINLDDLKTNKRSAVRAKDLADLENLPPRSIKKNRRRKGH